MKYIYAFLIFLVSGCGSEHSYKPHEDPFVLAYFEHYLDEEGVKYSKDAQGFYIASQSVIESVMVPTGEKASRKGLHTRSLALTSECSRNYLESKLDIEGIIYLTVVENGEIYVKMSADDDISNGLVGLAALAEQNCGS